ncbi:hypothetical protein ColTof4_06233 [Colletotrichum tofieldiae]|nr:hypothetical protein ColTof3_01418 [Colletotrichum tofieldiae]GKT73810.1 hypothetical protein ColTof4_06233 [Colletotrichum tofieldiae]
MGGERKLSPGLLDAQCSPVHKKRRIIRQNNLWEGTTDPRRRQCSRPKPFTKADAEALYRQMRRFEEDYQKEGCKTHKYASPKDIELGITRGNLHLRHHEIRDALYHTSYANPSRALPPSSRTYHHLVNFRAALTRHQALWHHRKALRRTLYSARAIKQKSAELASAEAADDADTERDIHDKNDTSCHRVSFERRRKWYRTVKKDMRKRGQWISKEAPGPGVEWEPVNVRENLGVRVKFFNPVAGDWILPKHVETGRDLEVYLNQLGLRFIPVLGRPEDRPWA